MRYSKYICVFIFSILLACGALRASAANLTVTISADENDGECVVDCSFRDAINLVGNGDSITFSPNLIRRTIRLNPALGLLVIDKDLAILGRGMGKNLIKIDGGGQLRVLRIRRDRKVDITNLVIQNGNVPNTPRTDGTSFSGGGIFNEGFLTLKNVVIRDNSAATSGGGIYSGEFGTLELSECLVENNFSNNGAGIFAAGNAKVSKTSIRQNRAANIGGGGFFVADSVFEYNQIAENVAGQAGGLFINNGVSTIIGSTISNNIANNLGGGGIYHSSGTLNVINSTVSGNSGILWGGGILCGSSILNIRNSTITNNTVEVVSTIPAGEGGGGIGMLLGSNISQTVTLGNTIVAGNMVTGKPPSGIVPAPDILIVPGGIVSLGNNLIGSTLRTSGWTVNDLLDLDAGLMPLANNGGRTLTHALSGNSPARNAGNNLLSIDLRTNQPLISDQRGNGFARIVGNSVDIGAFEVN